MNQDDVSKLTIRMEQLWGDEFLEDSSLWPEKSPAYAQPLEETQIPGTWKLLHSGPVEASGNVKVNVYLDGKITRIVYITV
ncbi:hypothetical protein GCK72_007346 [Caenorhabditis remanei]|uniref:Uncharacterized protein n=1 Tax=Caenorhabditis remanei TaxID=31234 RepID=A0A6A5HLP9_CAERE|nr:hypothetical protein GCK72_007346 [Caenorhabditis remanei]KAF1767387.1 hypothetical protein GCK72_007346 [Caenorhabditis remanei]